MRARVMMSVAMSVGMVGCQRMASGESARPALGLERAAAPSTSAPAEAASAQATGALTFARGAQRLMVGAGDIASCSEEGDEATAALLDRLVAARPDLQVFTLGDNVYPIGAASEFTDCYAPSWGRHKARTLPVLGNHDARTDRGRPYHDYFGARAGEWGKSRSVETFGAWTFITLNSNCDQVDCTESGEQAQWLRGVLEGVEGKGAEVHTRRACTALLWHHPRFSSGPHGDDVEMQPAWALAVAAQVELVMAGHDHGYERFAPLDTDGRPAEAGPIHLVAGTGGKHAYPFGTPREGSQARFTGLPAVVALDLADTGFRGAFMGADEGVRDTFAGQCR